MVKNSNNPKMNKKTRYVLYSIALFIFFIGIFLQMKNILLCSVLFLFIMNVFIAFYNKQKGYILYILFYAFIFLFILSRPTISFIKQREWWYFSTYSVNVAIFLLLLSFIFLDIGFYSSFAIKEVVVENKCDVDCSSDKTNKFLFITTIILLCASFIKEIIVMLKFYGSYAKIYTGASAEIPFVLEIMSGMAMYFVIMYLSTLPKKKNVMVTLVLYIVTGVPGLLLGGRNALMLKILFAVVYLIFRHFISGKEKWISKRSFLIVLCCIPIMMVVLGIMNYTRSNEEIPNAHPLVLAIDFLDKQGTSFDTLCQSIEYRNELRNDTYINYTFGELIDFILHNDISNILFDTEEFNGNSIENATLSNNLAHRLSYLVLGEQYLAGHGRGTTYFSELYLDFGFLGIIVVNYLLGVWFKVAFDLFSRGFLFRVVILNIFSYIYIIPRLAMFSIFSFLLNYYFWIAIVLLFVFIKIIERRK